MAENINNDRKFGNLENYDNELTNTALKENNQNKLREHYENITQALNARSSHHHSLVNSVK